MIFIKKLCCRTLDVHSIAFLFLSDMRICHAAGFYQKNIRIIRINWWNSIEK